MKRQYHTPQGVITAEPTDMELDMEFNMQKGSPIFRAQVLAMAELTGKTEEEVTESLKRAYKKAWKE